MFLSDISKEMGIPEFETYIEFAKRSNGKARVLQYRYSNPEIVESLMKHPSSHFMTDAWMETEGTQNPSCFGCFPRFLQIAREKKILSLEETVRKMTSANADRLDISDRGRLQEGLAADITVFDWNNIRDNTTEKHTDTPPSGIEQVFINGKHVLKNGIIMKNIKPGVMIK
jgi:N-acyl-D-amino-acid deacylase